jgi:hypothetical protein
VLVVGAADLCGESWPEQIPTQAQRGSTFCLSNLFTRQQCQSINFSGARYYVRLTVG